MPNFDAVIFDWSGTLVHDPSNEERVALAFAKLGRTEPHGIDRICESLRRWETDPEVVAAQVGSDTSTSRYYAAESLHFQRAGLDQELAEVLLHADEWPESRPLYPDALATLRTLKKQGCRIQVLSDIHFDIRPLLEDQGAGEFIDDYVLSFEHGIQKPEAEIFELALARLEVAPNRALMVGDRATHDGAATESGITSLLLPRIRTPDNRNLSIVNLLVG
ncbi:HAD family hydrolase [Arthrobacter sp. PAMC 25486]|uniref:HAD family hydrolase n=1 Tax=Arthrobacter sp. PAMC 25486 TaxID=1494608 RepID=UPI0009E011D7|nr:HAD family hydrolase [Arthrobacter sp. PAMC 25486]